MRLTISHTTRYTFSQPVSYGLQQLRQAPKSYRAQNVVTWSTEMVGAKRELSFEDYHRNTVELISLEPDSTELIIRSEGEVHMEDTQGIVGRHSGPAPLWLFKRATPLTRAGRGVRALISGVEGEKELDRLHSLSAAINGRVDYQIGASDISWSAEDALSAGQGVCQDHTHIFLAAARAMGFPARYVSGFLMLEGQKHQDATHAWAEAHVKDLGWVGFDISNGISPDMRYVRVATGLDYLEAAPVTGMRIGGATENLSVAVRVAQQ